MTMTLSACFQSQKTSEVWLTGVSYHCVFRRNIAQLAITKGLAGFSLSPSRPGSRAGEERVGGPALGAGVAV